MRKVTIVTSVREGGDFVYHIEADRSVLNAGFEALMAHIETLDLLDDFEWVVAVFDGHVYPLPGFGTHTELS
jgi:hypothetical protein